MFQLNRKILMLPVAILFLGACSSEPKKTELDQQVKAQPVASTPEQIAQRAAETFSNAPGLSVEQKQKLMVIYSKTYTESRAISAELGQSKSLLFQMLASVDYKSKDMNALKKKIKDLDGKRMSLMFQSLEDVQKVVGYGKDREEIYKHLRYYEFPDRASMSFQ